MMHFGMVQSLANPGYKKDWEHTFKKAGFRIISSQDLSEEKDNLCIHQTNRLSSIFTKLKKTAVLFAPRFWFGQIKTFVLIKKWHKHDGDHLKNYLFLLEKPHTD